MQSYLIEKIHQLHWPRDFFLAASVSEAAASSLQFESSSFKDLFLLKFLSSTAQFLQEVLSNDTLQSFFYRTTKLLSKMSGIQPVAVYAMKVPPGDILIPAVPEFAAMVSSR